MMQQYARGSLILLVGQVTSTIVLALGVVLVARFLGSVSYGQMTVAMIPISIVTLFSDLGVNSALTKYIAQYRSERRVEELGAVVRAGLLFNTAMGSALFMMTYLFSGFLAADVFHLPEIKSLIEVASITLFANSLIQTSYSVFIGFERMEFHSVAVILTAVLRSILAPLLVLAGFGAFGAVLGGTTSSVAVGILGLVIVLGTLLRGAGSSGGALSHLQAWKMLIAYGYPLFFGNLLTGGISQFYSFLMAIYVEASLIGNYQISTHFSLLITFLTMPIATVLFPFFSKLDAREEGTLGLVFQSSVKYAALVVVPLTTAIIALSDQIVWTIYGGTYLLAPFFLRLYVIGYLFVGLGSLSVGTLLNGQGKTKVTFWANLINLCVGLPLSLIMIPWYGIVGLLLTLIIAPHVGLFYALLWIKKNFGFTINIVASAKIYLSAGVAFLITYFILTTFNWRGFIDLIVGGVVFLFTYCILMPLTGALQKSDVQTLSSILNVLGPIAPLFRVFLLIMGKLIRQPKQAKVV